jgi:glycosyltransferase involved in cell wall biosynthesis
MSRVDIVVPCYNYGRFLRQCVQSVLMQERVDVRVLIIDDASSDDTETVGRRLAEEDPRVEFRLHSVNRGHIETYNEGIQWAGGDYMLLLSADDVLTPGALGRAARLMDTHPEVGLTYGRAIKTRKPTWDGLTPVAEDVFRIIPGVEFLRSFCAGGDNPVDTPTAVVRTWLQQLVGGYRKELPHGGDMEMWLRFAAHGAVGFVDADQAFYRRHGDNMSMQYLQLRDYLERKAVFDLFFKEYGVRIRSGKQLQRLADRGVAEQAIWDASRMFDEAEARECESYISFALQLCPTLRHWRQLYYLRLKRLLGAKGWGMLRPLIRRLRGRPVRSCFNPGERGASAPCSATTGG